MGSSYNTEKGLWIDKGWDGDWQFQIDGRGSCWRVYECSNCHKQIIGGIMKYCPNCGSYNKEKVNDPD